MTITELEERYQVARAIEANSTEEVRRRREAAVKWVEGHNVRRRVLRAHLNDTVKSLLSPAETADAENNALSSRFVRVDTGSPFVDERVTGRVIPFVEQFGEVALTRLASPLHKGVLLTELNLDDGVDYCTDGTLQEFVAGLPNVISGCARNLGGLAASHLLIPNGDRTFDHFELRRSAAEDQQGLTARYMLYGETILV